MIKNFCENIVKFKENIFFDKHLRWSISKLKINSFGEDKKSFKRGDVVKINLGYNIGSELNKERLGVIVSINSLNGEFIKTIIIVPIKNYDKNKEYKENIFFILRKEKFSFLEKDSVLDFLQIKSVSKKRIIKLVGEINDKNILNLIKNYLKNILF